MAPRNAPPEANSHEPPAMRGFVEGLGSVLTDAGMQRLPARVFAQLMADEDGRMTSAELAAALEVSAAAVSGAVRYLTQVSMIRRERERGTRRDVYVVLEDAWHDAMLQNERMYQPLRAVLAEGRAAAGGPGTPAGRRLDLSVEFIDFLTVEMAGIARRWEERKAEVGASRGQLDGRGEVGHGGR